MSDPVVQELRHRLKAMNELHQSLSHEIHNCVKNNNQKHDETSIMNGENIQQHPPSAKSNMDQDNGRNNKHKHLSTQKAIDRRANMGKREPVYTPLGGEDTVSIFPPSPGYQYRFQ